MPFASSESARIVTNIPAENAYNSLRKSGLEISLRQLRLSTGKRINNASDDVAAYITSRALQARNGALKASLKVVGDAKNITNIAMDSLDDITELVTMIKDGTSAAASGAMGTDEKIALAKAAWRMAQQVQTVVDSTVFGGRQLLDGTYSVNFYIATNATNDLISMAVNLSTSNPEFNVESNNFDLNSITTGNFAGITGLDLTSLNTINSNDLGIFADSVINVTLTSLTEALNNVSKTASFVGGIANRLDSQASLIEEQVTNYNAAISRLEDADVAMEQMELIKAQFLQQTSLTSLSQANQNPQAFLQLLQS
jgi:flagellin